MMNPIRFGGIASGLDTESLVKQLVSAERFKVDRFSQQKIWETWRQEAFNRTNKTMANFIVDSRKKLELTRVTSTGSLMANSYQNMSWVNKATSSNEGAFNVSATASASPGTYEMKVNKLATGVTLASGSNINGDTVEALGFGDGTKIQINGKEITLAKTDTLSQVATKIRNETGLNARFDAGSKRFFLSTTETGSNAKIEFGTDDNTKDFFSALKIDLTTGESYQFSSEKNNIDESTKLSEIDETFGDEVTIKINGKNIVLNKDDSLNDVINAINTKFESEDTDNKVVATFKDGNIIIKGKNINFDDTEGSDTKKFLEALKFPTQLTTVERTFQGQKAEIEFQGAKIEYDSNNINILGMSINLTSETSGIERITVSTDIDGAVDKIKEFVEEYNNIVEMMNLSLSEKQYRDFRPLTDEQRKAMGEEEIKLWDEKAKSGLLRGDQTISRLLQTMRSGLYEEVRDISLDDIDGVTDIKNINTKGTAVGSLFEFGITTGNFRDGGKLVIDEDKLRSALRDDPDKVIKTLFKSSSIPEENIKPNDSERDAKILKNAARRADTGVFSRLYDDMISGMKNIIDQSGPGNEATLLRSVRSNIMIDYVTKGSKSLIDDRINDIDKRIDRENIRIAGLEERYWRQFTALEKAMSQMNNQSAWLTQQFSSN